MVSFRCKRSGNLVSFINEGDIQGLRAHEGYEEIKDEKANEKPDEKTNESAVAESSTRLRLRGRPKKQ